MKVRPLDELLSVEKNKDDLNIEEALLYLNHISFKISIKTLQRRFCEGTGPAKTKRCGRLYFRKNDLDAWKKHETKSYEAYEKAI